MLYLFKYFKFKSLKLHYINLLFHSVMIDTWEKLLKKIHPLNDTFGEIIIIGKKFPIL
jgi:hypothetical protein